MDGEYSDYYVKRREQLIRKHDQLIAFGAGELKTRYGEAHSTAIINAAREAFAALIPRIPYIGGDANPLTDTLVQMTSLLALYQVMQSRGVPTEEIGALAQRMAQTRIESVPVVLRRLLGRLYMTRLWRERTRRKAVQSQRGDYPGNFVYEVVAGDGFEWGIDYHECGIVKFFHAQHADEFTPYMCLIDFLMFPAMGVHLERQGTIANGCTRCDFRFRHS